MNAVLAWVTVLRRRSLSINKSPSGMGMFLNYFSSLNLFIMIFMAIIFYFSAIYLLDVFDAEDANIFGKIFNRQV
jgi:hypothetical protein